MPGKRQRRNSASIRRTTSMSEVAAEAAEQARAQPRQARGAPTHTAAEAAGRVGVAVGGGAVQRRNSGDFPVVETAAFLKACGLCKRRLGPGRDTFIYRGEVAFCSLECRQQQINLDEHKEKKCSLTSIKDTSPSAAGSSDQSGNGETVAAA